jgi:hypothetical protein
MGRGLILSIFHMHISTIKDFKWGHPHWVHLYRTMGILLQS